MQSGVPRKLHFSRFTKYMYGPCSLPESYSPHFLSIRAPSRQAIMANPPLLILALFASTALCQSGSNILSFVDPLIGTVNGGHVFAGATLPFGMAKAVADVNGEDQGGFASDGSNITGFSHMHDSGTGGVSFGFVFGLVCFCSTRGWSHDVMLLFGLSKKRHTHGFDRHVFYMKSCRIRHS